MAHLTLPWWPKSHSARTTSCRGSSSSNTTSTSSATLGQNTSTSDCRCLSKMMKKLKKSSKILHLATSRQASFQCRYDPLSYSLNFDTSGSGDLSDEDYYKFCAFSSRFVATPGTDCHQVLVAASH